MLTALPEALRLLQDLTGVDLRMVIYSALLVAMMLVLRAAARRCSRNFPVRLPKKRARSDASCLEAQNADMQFGGLKALSNLSFQLEQRRAGFADRPGTAPEKRRSSTF